MQSHDDFLNVLKKENEQFTACYHWLHAHMPPPFFREVKTEWLHLIIHALMGFEEQGYFSQFLLKNSAITLCMNSPDADLRILKGFEYYGIKNYTSFLSDQPFPFITKKVPLRISLLHFTEAKEDFTKDPLEEKEIEELALLLHENDSELSIEQWKSLTRLVDPRFLRTMSRESQVISIYLYYKAKTRDHCQYDLFFEEKGELSNASSLTLSLAWKNTPSIIFFIGWPVLSTGMASA